jgi:hypothetical protein
MIIFENRQNGKRRKRFSQFGRTSEKNVAKSIAFKTISLSVLKMCSISFSFDRRTKQKMLRVLSQNVRRAYNKQWEYRKAYFFWLLYGVEP